MSNRKILVLGGTKYFGKHLVSQLLANGDEVTIVTRGKAAIPEGCRFVSFDRTGNDALVLNDEWDVVYDQSCFASSYLSGLKDVIKKSKLYILTSSQAVYPFAENINEDSVEYNNIDQYQAGVNEYGFEKIKAEKVVAELTNNYIFPRFPVVFGVNDAGKRVQNVLQKIAAGNITLPSSNPSFQLIDEYDTARALFDLPFKNFRGAINIADNEILHADAFCLKLAEMMQVDLTIQKTAEFSFAPFDLIRNESKTLCLKKQAELGLNIKNTNTSLRDIAAKINSVMS